MREIKLRGSSSAVRIYADEPFDEYYMTEGRRPAYRLRGRPVTPDEAVKIIAECDDLFSYAYRLKGSVSCSFLRMSYFDIAHAYNEHHGWVHPDGMIAQNSSSGIKNPIIREIMEDIYGVAENYPFLDMTVAVSKWDEICPAAYNLPVDQWKYYDDGSFADSIELGLHIHDRVIEVVRPGRAAELYEEYDRLYDSADRRKFFTDYYREYAMNAIGRGLLEKCLDVYGITDTNAFIKSGRREGRAFFGPSEFKGGGGAYTFCTGI